MKKIIYLFVVAIVATTSNTYAQYASDALRFSQSNYGSTARFKAMGGAQIGTGGDISSLGGNPAGLGLFTKSEFSLTPEFNQGKFNANYLNTNTNTNKNQLNINQVGAVFYAPMYKQKGQDTKKGIISSVFGLGYSRLNDYAMEVNYSGKNNKNSIADYFAEIAGTTSPNNLAAGSLEQMAYNNYLISFDNAAGNYFPETFADATQSNTQKKSEIRSGSVSEFNFSGAANISNQIYVGASVGLVDIRYTSDAQYTEQGKAREFTAGGVLTGANINYNLLFSQSQLTKGGGINGRLGVIFRAAEGLRLGATFQTPTWFVIDDSYTESLDNRGTVRGTVDDKTYDFTYNLRTPLKGSLGASYVIGGHGIISADIDYIDYASMSFSSNAGNGGDTKLISANNSAVKKNYQNAINYRVGGEVKINDVSIRAGYGLNGSPYKSDSDAIYDTKTYSGGIGYRSNGYYIDLAYQKVDGINNLSPYTLNNMTEPVANVKSTRDNIFLTLGLRF